MLPSQLNSMISTKWHVAFSLVQYRFFSTFFERALLPLCVPCLSSALFWRTSPYFASACNTRELLPPLCDFPFSGLLRGLYLYPSERLTFSLYVSLFSCGNNLCHAVFLRALKSQSFLLGLFSPASRLLRFSSRSFYSSHCLSNWWIKLEVLCSVHTTCKALRQRVE